MIHSEICDFDWLKQWARLAPTHIALKDGDTGRTLSYSDLYRKSRSAATELGRRFEVQAGDRVAMLATNEIEAVVLFFACLRLGAILVPINFRLTPRELDHILNDSAPKLLLAQSTFMETLKNCSHLPVVWSFEEFQSSLETERAINGSKGNGVGLENSALESSLTASGLPDRPCMILYTSGTTGAPKGAIITPKMLHWNSLTTTLRLNLSQSDVFVSFLPFFHTGGWNVLLTPFLHRGATTVLTKKFDAEKILALCESEKATILFGVPTTMEMMARSKSFPSVDISRVRYAIVGGEPMPLELIRVWQKKGIPIRQGFGLTEFGPNCFSLNEEDAIRKIGSIGFPNFYVEARIVDESRNDVHDGEIGELILRGPACTPGYWRNAEATKASIIDGWFHTGDLVRSDSEGYFFVAGRKKEMYISGGENVYPVEVESVLSQHPAVREVAVIGIPDTKWGESGRAYVALSERDGAPKPAGVTAEELISFCSDKLAKFKIPKSIVFLESLPKGDSGKILKRNLRDL